MGGEEAQVFFDKFVEMVRTEYMPERVHVGAFGEFMEVRLQNHGPVTILIDSRKASYNEDEKWARLGPRGRKAAERELVARGRISAPAPKPQKPPRKKHPKGSAPPAQEEAAPKVGVDNGAPPANPGMN